MCAGDRHKGDFEFLPMLVHCIWKSANTKMPDAAGKAHARVARHAGAGREADAGYRQHRWNHRTRSGSRPQLLPGWTGRIDFQPYPMNLMTQLAAETNHSKRYTAHPVPQQGADKAHED